MNKTEMRIKLKLNTTFVLNKDLDNDLGLFKNIKCVVGFPNLTYSDQDPLLDYNNVDDTLNLYAQ